MVVCLAIFNVNPALATTLLETATGNPSSLTAGTAIGYIQSYGTRFHLSETVEVTAIGGLMGDIDVEGGALYGAIVSLENSSAFPITSSPATTPFDVSEVIASTRFQITEGTKDYLFPLSTTLSPGDYALLFGSKLFGSIG